MVAVWIYWKEDICEILCYLCRVSEEFVGCLENTDLENADLENTDLKKADLGTADIETAVLENADHENTDLETLSVN